MTVSHVYDAAAPDIVQALTDFTRTSGTIAEQQANLSTLYGSVTTTSQDLTSYLRQNKDNIIRLSADSRGTLQTAGRVRPLLPLHAAHPRRLRAGHGQGARQGHRPARPARRRHHRAVARQVRRRARTPRSTARAAARSATRSRTPAAAPTPLANSPQENELVDELLAPAMKSAPSTLPDWSSLLTGPVFRGAEVTVK